MSRYIDAELLIEAMQGRKLANDECLRNGTDSSDKEYYRHLQFEDGIMMDFVREQPTADVVPIPDNATNGDMIKAMFPSEREELYISMTPMHLMYDGLDYWQEFRKDWWNAPYNRIEGE